MSTNDPRIDRATAQLSMFAEVFPRLMQTLGGITAYGKGVRADVGVSDEEYWALDETGRRDVWRRHARDVAPLVRKHAGITATEWRRLRIGEKHALLLEWRAVRDRQVSP